MEDFGSKPYDRTIRELVRNMIDTLIAKVLSIEYESLENLDTSLAKTSDNQVDFLAKILTKDNLKNKSSASFANCGEGTRMRL